MLIEVDLFL